MNKVKIHFCLFLFLLSFIYLYDNLKKIDLFNLFNDSSIEITSSILDTSFSENKKENYKKLLNNTEKPLVYFYNTHQTEEYKSSDYNIAPTVVTVSQMLKEKLKEEGINSIVEESSIKKGLDKYNYDYSGSYAISMMYLKNKKSKNPSLKYYFDIHRDSVKGRSSRVMIKNKSHAKIMFLVGKNHENYKQNVNNIKIMEDYLNKYYKGILRETYYQPLYSYNQEYNQNLFLIEIGGVDNTLEELYNTSLALGEAISYYARR